MVDYFYKARIAEVLENVFEDEYVKIDKLKIRKVNIFGTIVKKFVSEDGNYCALTIDDETGNIRVKVFKERIDSVEKINVGNLVAVFGFVKEKNDERYIAPVIISEIDLNTYVLNRLERSEKKGKSIIDQIKEIETPQGATFEDVQKKLNIPKKQVEEILFKLLTEGYIYEPKKGRYKVL